MCFPLSDGYEWTGTLYYGTADAPTVDFLCGAISPFDLSNAALSVFFVGVVSTSESFGFSVGTP